MLPTDDDDVMDVMRALSRGLSSGGSQNIHPHISPAPSPPPRMIQYKTTSRCNPARPASARLPGWLCGTASSSRRRTS